MSVKERFYPKRKAKNTQTQTKYKSFPPGDKQAAAVLNKKDCLSGRFYNLYIKKRQSVALSLFVCVQNTYSAGLN